MLNRELFKLLTFVIPMRVDCSDRLWNLNASLRFLTKNFEGSEIIVVEEAVRSKIQEVLAEFPPVRYVQIPTEASFRRAEGINEGARHANRPYICMYDTDVLICPVAIETALSRMQVQGWKIVLPFNHIFIDLSGILRQQVGHTGDISSLSRVRNPSQFSGLQDIATRTLEGGICVVHRSVFLAEGGMNKHMVSYGWEDTELHLRFKKLGYPMLHLPDFSLIHLNHERGVDSKPNEHYETNRLEFEKIKEMSKRELRRYVVTDLSITFLNRETDLADFRKALARGTFNAKLRLESTISLLMIYLQSGLFLEKLLRSMVRNFRRLYPGSV